MGVPTLRRVFTRRVFVGPYCFNHCNVLDWLANLISASFCKSCVFALLILTPSHAHTILNEGSRQATGGEGILSASPQQTI